jgi:hypothetical protein
VPGAQEGRIGGLVGNGDRDSVWKEGRWMVVTAALKICFYVFYVYFITTKFTG